MKRARQEPSAVDQAIESLVSEMQGFDGYSDEYTKMASNLRTLLEAKGSEPKPERIHPDTLATVTANIVGIAMILIFEKTNVITSKSLGLLIRPRT